MIKDEMTLPLGIDTTYLKSTQSVFTTATDAEILPYTIGFIPYDILDSAKLFRRTGKYTITSVPNVSFRSIEQTTLYDPEKGVPFAYTIKNLITDNKNFHGFYDTDQAAWNTSALGYSNTNLMLLDSYNTDYYVNSGTSYGMDVEGITLVFKFYEVLGDPGWKGSDPQTVAEKNDVTITATFSAVTPDITLSFSFNVSSDFGTHTYTIDQSIFQSMYSNGLFEIDGGTYTSGGTDYNRSLYGFIEQAYLSTSEAGQSPGFGIVIATGYRFTQTITETYHCYVRNQYGTQSINYILSGSESIFLYDSPYGYYWEFNEDSTSMFRYAISAWLNNAVFCGATWSDILICICTALPAYKINNAWYVAEFTDDYYITGKLIPYANARDWQKNINGDTNVFDPADIPEPTPEDDTADSGGDNILPYDFVNTPLSAANNFTTLYALTTDQVSKFGAIMWASLSDDNFWHSVGVVFTNDFSINPADMMRYFVFLRYYPFDLSGVSSSFSYGIYIGRSTYPIQFPTGTAYPRRVLRNLYQLDGGEVIVSLPAPYDSDDFYTMDPCTQVQAHIPYCGRVQLPASEVYGKTLKLQYVVDLQTGAIQAIISVASDTQYIIATLAGTCGASVQITANNNIEFLTRIATVATGGISEAGRMATQGVKIAGEEGAAAGAVLGALTGTVSALTGLPPVNVHSQGNTTGFANYGGDKRAYVTVVTVKRSIPQSFAKSCGYVSNKKAKIGDLRGYTEMINPDLSGVSAHEDELNEIYRILQSGFYA